jgi:hypothetical protein
MALMVGYHIACKVYPRWKWRLLERAFPWLDGEFDGAFERPCDW